MSRNESIVAVGMFDGVHRGHRYLLARLRERAADDGLRPVVVTFANHPRSLIGADTRPMLITEVEERLDLLHDAGIEDVVILPFDETLRNMTAADFVGSVLIPRVGCRAVILGYDNRFGSDRLSGCEAYVEALKPLDVRVYDCESMPGGDVSSSMIRTSLRAGDIAEVNAMLGRTYSISGTVVSGRRIGRTIGFPTANIKTAPDVILPANGVYAARIGDTPAMLNIGTAPTVNSADDAPVTVEAHLILPEGAPTPDLYGEPLTANLIARLRDEKRFAGVDELRHALEHDREETVRVIGNGY